MFRLILPRSSEASVASVISQSTNTTFTCTRERLVYFVVSDDGVLIAMYNDDDSAVIKLKDVTADHYTDWRLNVRPAVSVLGAHHSWCRAVYGCGFHRYSGHDTIAH